MHDCPNRMLVRAPEQEGTKFPTPSLIVAFVLLESAFQKVLTTRIVSRDWVTHQDCPKIARAKQPFTIT
jgi:hypothetical protein